MYVSSAGRGITNSGNGFKKDITKVLVTAVKALLEESPGLGLTGSSLAKPAHSRRD